MPLGKQRDSLDEETTNWRAVCGKTARAVRRAGSVKADLDPYHAVLWAALGLLSQEGTSTSMFK
jgi:hypothetical protein